MITGYSMRRITEKWIPGTTNGISLRAAHSGLSVVPKFSLVENIGFGVDGAHGVTASAGKRYQILVRPMPFPVTHPRFLFADHHYDQLVVRTVYPRSLGRRLRIAASQLLHRWRSR